MSTSRISTAGTKRKPLSSRKSPKPSTKSSSKAKSKDASPSSMEAITPTTPTSPFLSEDPFDISRDDIEREKKNLNLDNFIRKLSISSTIDINLIENEETAPKKKDKKKKGHRKMSGPALLDDRRPSIVVDHVDDNDPEKSKNKDAVAKMQNSIAAAACNFFSKTVQPPTSLKELVHDEINREESDLDKMMRQSQVVAAFGRRLFDETELKVSTSEEDDENEDGKDNDEKSKKKKSKKKKAQKVVVQSRYMQMFQKDEPQKKKDEKDIIDGGIEGEEAISIIEENPTNFGVWDRVLDPASAKLRVEKTFKKKTAQQLIDDEVKQLEIAEQKRLREGIGSDEELDEDGEKPEEVREAPFRNLTATGKYLHETDLKWCKTYTKFSEKEIMKWFRRFRALAPRGDMTMKHVKEVYHRLFIGGNSDFFTEQIFKNFDLEKKKVLDFKVYLFMVQVNTLSSTPEKLNWIFQLMDLDNTGVMQLTEMETAVKLFEAIERPVRTDKEYEKDFDLSLEATAEMLALRSMEERMERIIDHIDGETRIEISRDDFEAIPTRIISSCDF